MKIFYTSRELSRKFNINLARWKRWTREFLSPDPLGGLQSGYARQYSHDEAFTVVLAGHLVAELKFSIPETKQILNDLRQWLVDHNFYLYSSKSAKSIGSRSATANGYQIAITGPSAEHASESGLSYRIRDILGDDVMIVDGVRTRCLQFTEYFIEPSADHLRRYDTESSRVVNISGLYKKFMDCLDK